jgi:tight adherence protein C
MTLLNLLIGAAVGLGAYGVGSLLFSLHTEAAQLPSIPGSLLHRNRGTLGQVARLGTSLLPQRESERRALRLALLQADFTSPLAPELYSFLRVALALSLPLVAMGLLWLSPWASKRSLLFIGALAGMAGYLLPVIWVTRRRTANQLRVRNGLPDVLDLLLVCSEAGLGLDMAIARVAEELATPQPLLAKNLRQMGSELRAGRPRADAMRGFAERAGTPEAVSLVRLLIQSDIQGTSIMMALRVFSEEMRSHRMLRAEEAAHKMSAKLSVILIFTFMPALFIAIGGPVMFKLLAALAEVAK